MLFLKLFISIAALVVMVKCDPRATGGVTPQVQPASTEIAGDNTPSTAKHFLNNMHRVHLSMKPTYNDELRRLMHGKIVTVGMKDRRDNPELPTALRNYAGAIYDVAKPRKRLAKQRLNDILRQNGLETSPPGPHSALRIHHEA